jgi:hypothetical protein
MIAAGHLRTGLVAATIAATIGSCEIAVDHTPPSITVQHELSATLSADTPWLVRALRLRAAPGRQQVRSTEASISSVSHMGETYVSNVWVSVVNPDDGRFVTYLSTVRAASQGGASLDCPDQTCDETWSVVVRLLDPAPDETVETTITGALRADAAGYPEAGATFGLDVFEVAEVDVPDPAPTRIADAQVSGRWRIAQGESQITRNYLVEVDDAVLSAARDMPLIARLAFLTEYTASSDDDILLNAAIQVADDPAGSVLPIGGRSTFEMELVDLCADRAPCRVPLTITWSVIARVAGASPAPGDWAESRWWLAATVEGDPALDLQGDGVRITETDAGVR